MNSKGLYSIFRQLPAGQLFLQEATPADVGDALSALTLQQPEEQFNAHLDGEHVFSFQGNIGGVPLLLSPVNPSPWDRLDSSLER